MASDEILELTDANFDEEVQRSRGPLLVDFWAAWCPPCRRIAPALEELAVELAGRARVGKVDVDANGDVASRFGVRSIPTLIVFKKGRVVDQVIGAAPKEQLRDLVEKHID